MRSQLSRRMLLRGVTGGAFALPLLNDIRGAAAQAAPFPQRLVVGFTPNGTIQSSWNSTGSGATLKLGPIFNPLVMAGHQNDLVVVHGLDAKAAMDGPGGDAHGMAIGTLLTATEVLPGSQFLAGCGVVGQFCGSSGWPGGASIDQFIAKRIGTKTKFLSLDFAIKRMSGSIWSRMSYSEAGVPVTPMDDPSVAFDRIFADLGTDPALLARQRARRTSVLDAISPRYSALSKALSGVDKQKVDAHLSALSDIRSRIGVIDVVNGTCAKPSRPTLTASPDVVYNPSGMETANPAADVDTPMRNEVARNLLVSSLACDLTRVGTILMAPSRSDIFMSWLNINASHHDLSHDPDSNTMSSLITALKSVKEGNGTLFDNTVVLWCNELGIGNNHSHAQLPLVIAAASGGYFKTGQAVTMPAGTPHNRILMSLCHAMGMTDVKAFGNPKFCTDGPIKEIMA